MNFYSKDIRKLALSIDNILFVKNDLKNIVFSSYKSYNQSDHKLENIMKEEHHAFLELTKVDNIIIQRADKGNVIVIIDKNVYVDKIESIVSDKFKFQEVKFTTVNGELDYLLKDETELTSSYAIGRKSGLKNALNNLHLNITSVLWMTHLFCLNRRIM